MNWVLWVALILYVYVISVQGQDGILPGTSRMHRIVPRHTTIEPRIDNKSMESILESINDKLSALQSLDEQHIKRLDSIELRITRIQSVNHDKIESVRSELRNLFKKIDAIGTTVSHIDTSFNHNKLNVDEQQSPSPVLESHQLKSRSVDTEPSELMTDQKLDALATLLTSTRSAVGRIEKGLYQLQSNVSHLQASTKTIHHIQRNIPTKQFLNSILQRTQFLPTGEGYSLSRDGVPSSCSHTEGSKTGIYQIQLRANMKPFYVRCDETSEDKWTVILNRFNGVTNFYRTWTEYKNGFGNIAAEFWIGLDKLYEITNSKLHELYIVLEDFEGVTQHARYAQFAIGDESEDYALNVLGEYSGTAGDSLSYHAGSKFSTFDVDNDAWLEGNCAQSHTGAWWYSSCDMTNLNGKYLHGNVSELARFQGMYWNEFHGPTYSLRSVKMLVKSIDNDY